MAFVFQAEKNMLNKPSGAPQNVGPGSYLSHEQYKIKQGNVPFDAQVIRNQPIRKDNSPGPGSYNIQNEDQGQNIVLQSSQSDVKVIEKPQPQSVFASQTKRFHPPKTMLSPGPGAYDTTNCGTRVIQQQYTSQHYIETVMKLNKYQSIPSIPSSNQVFGYTEKGTHDLEVNKIPFQTFTGLKQDSVGPGQYDAKDAFEQNKYKGNFWHKSKVPRLAPTISKEKELMVGPGTYDPNASVVPLHKLNPSGNFQSKSQRMFDSTKEEKQKQFMKIFSDKQKDRFSKNAANYIEDDDYIFCDDTTPGPGQYLGNISNQSAISTNTQSTTKMGKNCFGSKSRRFQEKKMPCYVGPGDYEMEKDIIKEGVSQKQPPFQSTNLRFNVKSQEKRPGPQSYNPKITLENKLIKKLERAPVGNFGSNQQRFKQQENEMPGPGAYDENNKKAKGIASVFTSKTKRADATSAPKDSYPAPGAYDVKNYTIEQNTKIEKEEDPDLAIYKPAFGSSLLKIIENFLFQFIFSHFFFNYRILLENILLYLDLNIKKRRILMNKMKKKMNKQEYIIIHHFIIKKNLLVLFLILEQISLNMRKKKKIYLVQGSTLIQRKIHGINLLLIFYSKKYENFAQYIHYYIIIKFTFSLNLSK